MKRILIVEDDYKLNQGICYALAKEHYDVLSSHSIEEAKSAYDLKGADMILLDVNLPDGEGFDFCSRIKEKREIPVLFITARDLEEDALKGYESGADDYITKPFSMKVLIKKIDIIFKRIPDNNSNIFDDGYLFIDFEKAKATVNGEECIFTPTEFRLLRQLIENKGQLLTYSILLERLWDCNGQFTDKHTLAVNVNRLRGKIEDSEHRYISNVYGMGYQWLD